jgi:hypothetical protein
MNEFIKVSPLRILEMSSHEGLGRGNLGVLMARAGVGKTACLIHIALDKIFHGEKLVHVSLEGGPEKVTSYYDAIFYDLLKALDIGNESDNRMLLDRNRVILAYLKNSFVMNRLKENLNNLIEKLGFRPDSLIIDGLDFEHAGREIFEDFKALAQEFNVEIWFSALIHRHITDTNEKGIPYPCNQMDDLFSTIVHLESTASGVFLKLLKDHDSLVKSDASVRLDPNTFLAIV